jgi:hypothetical protein
MDEGPTPKNAQAGWIPSRFANFKSHTPVNIKIKRDSPLPITDKSQAATEETLLLSSIPGMKESIKKGMAEPLSKSSKTLKW